MTKTDQYQAVTDRIIAALDQGIVPWSKPWRSPSGEALVPLSGQTGKPYRGLNVWLLDIEAAMRGYKSLYWYTFNQCKTRAAEAAERDPSLKVDGKAPYWGPRKGESATTVYLWKWVVKEDADGNEVSRFPILRTFQVFNGDQLVMPEEFQTPNPETPEAPTQEWDDVQSLEDIVHGMPQRPTVVHEEQDRAFYRPLTDTVCMPLRAQFEDPTRYYSTLVHELAHATGHESRLKRDGVVSGARFGSDVYSREELVAEMTSAMVLSVAGVTPDFDQSVAYIAGWSKSLREDPRLFVTASQQAQKAADFILGTRFEDQ